MATYDTDDLTRFQQTEAQQARVERARERARNPVRERPEDGDVTDLFENRGRIPLTEATAAADPDDRREMFSTAFQQVDGLLENIAALHHMSYQMGNTDDWFEAQNESATQDNENNNPFALPILVHRFPNGRVRDTFRPQLHDGDYEESLHGPVAHFQDLASAHIERLTDNFDIEAIVDSFAHNMDEGERQELVDELQERLYEDVGDRDRYDGGYSFWRPTLDTEPRDHPHFDEYLQELMDQGRLEEREDEDGDLDIFPVEGEEAIHDEIFPPGGDDEMVRAPTYFTDTQSMENWLETIQELQRDTEAAFRNFAGLLGNTQGMFGEDEMALPDLEELPEPQVEEEDEDVRPEDDLIQLVEPPGDEEIQGSGRADVIRLGTNRQESSTQRLLKIRR